MRKNEDGWRMDVGKFNFLPGCFGMCLEFWNRLYLLYVKMLQFSNENGFEFWRSKKLFPRLLPVLYQGLLLAVTTDGAGSQTKVDSMQGNGHNDFWPKIYCVSFLLILATSGGLREPYSMGISPWSPAAMHVFQSNKLPLQLILTLDTLFSSELLRQ